MNIIKIAIYIYFIMSFCQAITTNFFPKHQIKNIDEDWSNEDKIYNKKKLDEKNDFKFDEVDTLKNNEEENNELYEFWNNLDMCNNVHCKSNQYCRIDENKNAICLNKKINTEKIKTNKQLNCEPCTISTSEFFCSSKNKTFSSLCRLSYYNCLHLSNDYPACKGMCPCKNEKKKNFNLLKNNQEFILVKSNLMKYKKKYICSSIELEEIGQRLYNWFTVILKSQSKENVKLNNLIKKINFAITSQCTEEVNWMFFNLDVNKDLNLSLDELYDLEHDHKEKCLKQYINMCDTNYDHLLNNNEWCTCFEKFKPCIKKRNEKKLNKKIFNTFVPQCDKNGNYEPLQCDRSNGFCWCVDKNGIEIRNTKKFGKVVCETKKYIESDDDTENDEDDDFEDYQSEIDGSGA